MLLQSLLLKSLGVPWQSGSGPCVLAASSLLLLSAAVIGQIYASEMPSEGADSLRAFSACLSLQSKQAGQHPGALAGQHGADTHAGNVPAGRDGPFAPLDVRHHCEGNGTPDPALGTTSPDDWHPWEMAAGLRKSHRAAQTQTGEAIGAAVQAWGALAEQGWEPAELPAPTDVSVGLSTCLCCCFPSLSSSSTNIQPMVIKQETQTACLLGARVCLWQGLEAEPLSPAGPNHLRAYREEGPPSPLHTREASRQVHLPPENQLCKSSLRLGPCRSIYLGFQTTLITMVPAHPLPSK